MSALSTWWDQRSKRPLVVALAALAGAATLSWAPAQAVDDAPGAAVGGAVEAPVVGRAAAAKPAFTASKALTRTFVNEDGSRYDFPTNNVTVSVDHTRNLRSRERVEVSWTGAQPSGGRAGDPYGVRGMNQEYPVVILQCRGVADPSAPVEKQISPETCWTNSLAQRSQLTRSEFEASWTRDLYADEAARGRLSGVAPFPSAKECPIADIAPYFTRLTPFRNAKGRTFTACDSVTMPPEAAVDSAFPPAEIAAYTDGDGKGSVQFEVRTDVENESLGCNNKTACAIVVIPINGLSCARPASPATQADDACRKGGRFLPGSSNFANEAVDQAVSPALWWAASNWRNRITVPITFGLPPDTCDILDPRAPTGFYGSELLAQAALQWAPAYCLEKKRFKFQHNQMSDAQGFNLMENGGGAAAVVLSEHRRKGQDPVGYAPTAVTGFAIGYNIDRPDNAGEYTRLRLNARLLAKLMTQSYLGSILGREHPGIKENPLGLMTDPEFIRLNPGLSRIEKEAGAALLSLSNESDVVQQLTAYVAEDEEAMAFVNGKADPWGMKVNPAYRKIELPRSEWPLLDEFVPDAGSACLKANPGVYFSQLAAPVTNLRKISEALLDGWPNLQTRCDVDSATGLFKVGRVDRQSYGSRFMLGVVSLGDAARFGLRTAALETRKGSYVAPSDASIGAALKLGVQDKRYQPFEITQRDLRRSKTAYPGTMVVYTAARLRNLPADDAAKVAQFIEIAISEGQRQGSGNGELPEGYLPIRKKGVTAALHASALQVAQAVKAQKPAPTAPPSTEAAGGGDAPTVVDPPGAPADAPAADVPSASAPAAPVSSASAAPVATDPTAAISSRTAQRTMPTLIVIGLLGIAIASGLRFVLQSPRRP